MELLECLRRRSLLVLDSILICCIRKAVGRELAVTKITCVQCKLGSERNCRHEVGCVKIIVEAGNVEVNDTGDPLERRRGVDDVDTSTDETSGSEYRSYDDDSVVSLGMKDGSAGS